MGGVFKALNSIMGVLAIVVCLAATGVIVYSSLNPKMGGSSPLAASTGSPDISVSPDVAATPSEAPSTTPGHIHDYQETVDLQATCLAGGRLRFICECGDFYFVETPAVGHQPDDWEITVQPTATKEGLRVKKCIYCDEVLVSEVIPATGSGAVGSSPGPSHVHEYMPSVESEPTCTVAGIRRFTCSCGSYYKENIPAMGHLAGGWTEVTKPTATETGIQQRICTVCHTMIDSRVIPVLQGSPSPSKSPAPSGTNPSASPKPTATPTATPKPTPHSHNFVWYVYKEATCTEKGIMTGNCSCGEEDHKPIDVDKDNHKFSLVSVVQATATSEGYTRYVCERCGESKKENIIPPTG